jgi:hypothetical protein
MGLTKRMMTEEYDADDAAIDARVSVNFDHTRPCEWQFNMLGHHYIPNLNWRRVCGIPKDTKCMITCRGSATPKTIFQFINKFKLASGGDVYVSQAQWLNPSRVPPKHRRKYKRGHWQNVLIGCDMCVDVDELDIATYDKIVLFSPYLVVRTNRGFQAWFQMDYTHNQMPENRNEREAFFQNLLDSHVKAMQGAGIDADWKCTADLRHVFRFPGTLHRSGVLCHILYSHAGAVFRMPSGILQNKRHKRTEVAQAANDGLRKV